MGRKTPVAVAALLLLSVVAAQPPVSQVRCSCRLRCIKHDSHTLQHADALDAQRKWLADAALCLNL